MSSLLHLTQTLQEERCWIFECVPGYPPDVVKAALVTGKARIHGFQVIDDCERVLASVKSQRNPYTRLPSIWTDTAGFESEQISQSTNISDEKQLSQNKPIETCTVPY